ncbi:glutathione S-transferase N-terminal domain-containing protein [Musicola keenii]|uniref:glutathione S-transferase N-terminal domain-containing protein n=1 Tax=Musicola keenii TaxID=2884250 RepID=UPI00177E46F1|nr:glutathione S-transferase N-terminal domain-containing protein [Musicola keenii]
MQLYLNETSPFSRVVVATALLSHCSPLTFIWVDPWNSPINLKSVNPFCLIPALELDNGVALTESLCICQYLIATYQPQALRQVDSAQAHEIKHLGVAKTLMEIAFRTAVLARYTENDNALIQRGQAGMMAALKQLNKEIGDEGVNTRLTPNLATLYSHAALEYVQFRHGALFNEVDNKNVVDFLQCSPFASVLSLINTACLAKKPDYASLLSDFIRQPRA